jgi:Uncharacterized protein conserved in bacteria
MGSEKVKVNVRIGGNDYTIVGVDGEEHIQRVAMYIDKKMNEITRSNNRLSTSMSAVLTAINIGDDYIRIREQTLENERYFKDVNEELKALKAEVEKLTSENTILEKRNTGLQIELARREAELSEVRNAFDSGVKQRMYIAK